MNSRHKKTDDERPGDNSPVCWPLIETEKQLRQQVTEEHWATNRPRTLGANLHVLASRYDPQVPLGVVVSPLLARTTRPLLCRSCATHTSSSYDSNDVAACGGAISRTHCSRPVDAAPHVHDLTFPLLVYARSRIRDAPTLLKHAKNTPMARHTRTCQDYC